MAHWNFLTNHARVLLCIAHDPGVRLREIATTVGITERSAYGIVTDLTESGYVVKQKEEKDGRRNRYQIQGHLPLRETISRERTIGEVLDLLVDQNTLAREDEEAVG
jgi:predicted transcriptional regulator